MLTSTAEGGTIMMAISRTPPPSIFQNPLAKTRQARSDRDVPDCLVPPCLPHSADPHVLDRTCLDTFERRQDVDHERPKSLKGDLTGPE